MALPLGFRQLNNHALSVRARELFDLALGSAPLFFLFLVINWWVMSVARLPESSYFQPSITLELLRHAGLLHIAVILLVAGLLIWRKSPAWRWTDITHGERWRPWLLLLVTILLWTYTTYDYNLYFDQGHYWDRILVLALAAAVVWRPIFLLPFVLLVTALATQYDYPIGGSSVAEQFVLVRILILFFAALVLQSLVARPVSGAFSFLLLTLIASSYWWPGLGKLRLLWFTHGQIHLLLPAAYSSGWLAFLGSESIASISQFLAKLDPMMVAFTLFAECGAILFLWRRSFARLLLGSWIVLHLGIVALSGIFFWKWMLLDLGLLWLLSRPAHLQLFPVFGREFLLLSFVLIGASRFWYHPVNLSWYDAPVNYAYRFEAIGESGRTYQLPPRFFTPYEYQFSLGNFGYLVREPRLSIVYGGIWERDVAADLLAVKTAPDLFHFETARGTVRSDTRRAARFETFIQKCMTGLNARGFRKSHFTALQAPSQLLSFPYKAEFDGGEAIVQVDVHQVTSLFDGAQYLEVRDEIVRQIEIPSPVLLEPEAN